MSRVDMFCAGDDRHRVALLEDLLQQAGLRVVLHSAAPEEPPSDPCIVACTSRALKQPWIVELFSAAGDVVALRLDDTPLPGPCSRIIDLQSWPARSADRHVGALVDWLIRHGHGRGDGPVAGRDPAPGPPGGFGAADAGPSGRQQDAPAAAAGSRRRRLRSGTSEVRRVLIILAILVAGGVLLWSSRPERGVPAQLEGPVAEDVSMLEAPPLPPAGSGVDGLPGTHEPAGAPPAATAPAAGSDGIVAAETAAPGASQIEENPGTEAMDGGAPEPAGPPVDNQGILDTAAGRARPWAPPAPDTPGPHGGVDYADALAHLCAANSLRAARAWAAALDWKQRRRAADEACVARLLARPGYRVLVPVLGLP